MSLENAHERRFVARLANIRKLRGLTQEELAAAAGFKRSVIAAIETEVRGVRLGDAVALCAALDVELAAMVSDEPMTLCVETPVDSMNGWSPK